MMRKLLLLILLLNFLPIRASHIIGGDIYYDYLGNDTYRFYISLYRDCLSTGAAYDDPMYLAVYNQDNFLIQNVQIPFPGSNVLPVIFNNPCVTPPGNICTEVATYVTTINLPAAVGGYTITYQRCCRGPNINNLVNPDDTGITLTCKVPGVDTGANINSSPRFTNYPPLLLCNNEDLVFDHSATDPDGDQLVYSLVAPFQGGGPPPNAQPNPASPPNYMPIIWNNGFSTVNPLGPGASINIDPATGLLTASPNLLGRFVVGIQVEEIRNGVVINRTIRDFIFQVFNCQLQLEAILPTQEQLPGFVSYCQGLDVDFVNNSYGGTNYEWDFGVPAINNDVSTAFEPSFTYPAPGIYNVQLVVNPGWPCTDTTFMEVNVNNELEVGFTSNDSLCIFGNSFDFEAFSNNPNPVEYNWDFGITADQQFANGQIVNDISYPETGFQYVTVEGVNGVCVDTYTDSVFIFPEPIAEIVIPDDVECLGFDIAFGNASQNSTIYDWDFGVAGTTQDVSTDVSPTYVFPGPGVYDVTLIAGSTPECKDTVTESIELNEPLVLAFTHQDSMCVTGNSFDFDGTVSGPPDAVYTWNFGPDASIANSNQVDVNGVSFNTTGSVPITLTGSHDNCQESISSSVYLYSEPTINFALEPGLQCAPFNAQFIDLSTAETGIQYNWDFGDGSTSTEQNPSHTYVNVGPYPVTLTIATTSGCATTLTLLEPDIVNVRPKPEAGFILSTDYTDICHSSITFYDDSQGAVEYFYWFTDGTAFSDESSPSHLYLTDGKHYPFQIVTNEWGCKDTTYQELYIEPYTFYAPNTFTPDGDEHNNVFKTEAYLDVDQYDIKIFDRWGGVVYQSNDILEVWDGTLPNGMMAPDGTYIYKVELESCEPVNNEKIITGHINVLR